jgi:uncharacterized membrane protein YeiB
LNLTLVTGGAIIMGYAVAAVFFLKFWRRTADSLFLAFAAAFLLLAATPLLTALLEVPREEQSPFYLLRLLAFLIIIVAIVGKSRRRS